MLRLFSRLSFTFTILIFISACSTHQTVVEYEGSGIAAPEAGPTINSIVVSDDRGTESNWLGAIRGGYGNVLKTLQTEQSTDIIVDQMYTAALGQSGIYSTDIDGPYSLKVSISKFDCSYYFNREAHAHVRISLIENESRNAVFEKSYKTDETESGVGAGVFGDVDTLRDLAELAMNKTIDKMLSDDEFILAATKQSETAVGIRIKKLESLYREDLITEKEYLDKREKILSEI
ncbi:SHOCT domain-containing protein [Pseudohalioglobus sediminis]|uniref:SHOCT domain-containing protein n=1 Tax=Pseudohalioglobus sediminis TaxID=2606449 RepID=A0A5B0WTU5_9GAMM|nr:SHOCT domain-containing protein [Pseudohalioglobus sediminis]KAA1190500.1 SHOCT domain-containing protein [Pseudohalioglobus sediminis]